MEAEFTNNRRKGRIERLPKELRDKVNSMLDDGATYPDIVTELEKSNTPPLPYSINADSIRSWYSGGYQDYLKAQDSSPSMPTASSISARKIQPKLPPAVSTPPSSK